MASHGEEEDLDALRSMVLASMKNKSSSVQEDEDEDLELQKLREAALKTKKSSASAKPAPIPLLEIPLLPQPVETIPTIHTDVRLPPLSQEAALLPRGPFMPRRGVFHRGQPSHRRGFHLQGARGGNIGWSNINARPGAAPRGGNLIVIQPLPMEGEEPQPPRGMGRGDANGSGMAAVSGGSGRGQSSSKPGLVRPQDKWLTSSGSSQAAPEEPAPKSRDKFSRYNHSDSEESEDSDEEASRTERHYFHYSSDEADASFDEAETASGPADCEESNVSNTSDDGSFDQPVSPQPGDNHEQSSSHQPSNSNDLLAPLQVGEICDQPTLSPKALAQSSSRSKQNHGIGSSESNSSSSSSSSSSGDSGGEESDKESGLSDAASAKNNAGKASLVSSPVSSTTNILHASSDSCGLLSPHEPSAGCENVPVFAKADSTLSPRSPPGKSDSRTSQSNRGEPSLDSCEREKREARRRKFESNSELDLSNTATKKISLKGIVSSSTQQRTETKDLMEPKPQSSPSRSDSRSPAPSSRGSVSSDRERSPKRYYRHRSPLQPKDGSPHYNHRGRPEKEDRHRPRSDRPSQNPRIRRKDDVHSVRSSGDGLSSVEKRSDVPKQDLQDSVLNNKNQNAHLSDSDSDEEERLWRRRLGVQTGSPSLQPKVNSKQPIDSQCPSSVRSGSRHQNHNRVSKPLSINGGRGYSSQSRHSDSERGFLQRRSYVDNLVSDSDSDSNETSNKRPLCSSIIRPAPDRNGKRHSSSPSLHDEQSTLKCRRISDEADSSHTRARDQAMSEDSDGTKNLHKESHPVQTQLADPDNKAAKSAKGSKRVWAEEDSDSRKSVAKISVHERLGRKVTEHVGPHKEYKRSVLVPSDSSEGKVVDRPVVKKSLNLGVAVKENNIVLSKDSSTGRGSGGVFKRAAAGLGNEKAAEKPSTKEELLEQKMTRMKEMNQAILRRHKEIEEDKKRHGSL